MEEEDEYSYYTINNCGHSNMNNIGNSKRYITSTIPLKVPYTIGLKIFILIRVHTIQFSIIQTVELERKQEL